MLKFLSSHRGLTPDLFDEYSRRQFLAKAPSKNPFGPADEPPFRFTDLDVFTKVSNVGGSTNATEYLMLKLS